MGGGDWDEKWRRWWSEARLSPLQAQVACFGLAIAGGSSRGSCCTLCWFLQNIWLATVESSRLSYMEAEVIVFLGHQKILG